MMSQPAWIMQEFFSEKVDYKCISNSTLNFTIFFLILSNVNFFDLLKNYAKITTVLGLLVNCKAITSELNPF